MKKVILLFATSLLYIVSLSAQPPCGFDQMHRKLLTTDPAYARQVTRNNLSIRQYIERHPALKTHGFRTMALYTIPVVVHVMHTGDVIGSVYNPSDAQITGAIDYLNEVYAGTLAGMTAPVEGGGIVNMEIQFALAQRTPSCETTNGIDRVDVSSLSDYVDNGVNASASDGVPDEVLKNFARWDPSNYYNIWVVNKIDGADGTSGQFIAGYAYFAGAPPNLDGTVMLATQMVAGEKTLPHEIGHALNLYHPFEDSDHDGDCPSTDCSLGDEVCDTDPVTQNYNLETELFNFNCRTGENDCMPGTTNYNINTESNFMSYTDCYTLFTNLQKTRVQAAMTLPTRASLVAPGNLALTPCGTTINFSLASAASTEDIAGTLTGCRRYRDYTYQMTIGAAPTATATATLIYDGDATKGIDYDVTTNGNFASPSDILSFTSGSTAAQSFTVRIYDDGDVEAEETAIIDFNLDDGDGDATKGTFIPTFSLAISDNDIAPAGVTPVTADIGSNDVGLQQPFRGEFTDSRTQMLYTKAELNATGISGAANIYSIAFYIITKNSNGPFNGFTVRMKNTTATSYNGGSFETGATQVFTGNYTTTAGLNTITLTTPFTWNGNDNLLVDICFNNTVAVNNDIILGTNALPQSHFERVNGATGCTLATANSIFGGGGARPDIRINAVIIATPVETVASSVSNMYMVPGSNDYFYSNNNRLMMKLSGISASLGCVESTLENAGTAWVGYSGGQRSAKVFAVTPATNAGTTDYTIELYFDDTELDGRNPATLRLAKTTAASAAAANGSNTILITPTVSTPGIGTTVFSGSFTGFSRFFLVDAAVTLPVSLTGFSGKSNEANNTVLKWITASEQNNKQFDLEVSDDGIHFVSLGTVASQGNSATNQYYEFLHMNPPAGTSWYRLKQTDWDNRFQYSNIISVTISREILKPFIYPVPAGNMLTVNFGHIAHRAVISIFTADMKTVMNETINGLTLKKDINIAGLSKGVYFIRITTEKGIELLRFIKK